LETIACHYRLWQHIHMCRKAAPQREVWRQLRVITDWGRKVESPCQVQNCVANPEASRLAPFTAPMGSVWVTSPMEHFQQCQFVTRAWTQQIPLPMTSSGELGESKALVNEDVVAQSSIHCHSQISSINSNARAGLGCSEAPLSMRMLSNKSLQFLSDTKQLLQHLYDEWCQPSPMEYLQQWLTAHREIGATSAFR
jgi:hypothetical protein